ncbi:hypothetical protein NLJ89_g4939 [Agrocybe chaxingu]|uniref:YDG domain-containing protein n=1 Tax=Agrocybe chaxingu TaxID=84603 RepID=A0A9W8K1R9_9AGAR|nr:hypothetical protein NLJ89_g4939 [Agrocybe chaxingu]
MTERLRKQLMGSTELYDPNMMGNQLPQFGPIEGVEVGAVFESRAECARKGVHPRNVAGIAGIQKDGAYSICLSSGYEDDKDDGDFFVYTGTGGQQDSFSVSKKQVADQSFEHKDNYALLKSVETKRPVRVVRGPNPRSKYAPVQYYRYDGLYTVEKAYLDKGKSQFTVCKYELRRLPGQRPIPINPDFNTRKRK